MDVAYLLVGLVVTLIGVIALMISMPAGIVVCCLAGFLFGLSAVARAKGWN